jgi:hypothetical protein
VADLARGLGIDVRTAGRYLDLLVDLLLVRRLPLWHANVGKRLVKSPKVYVRDSGLVHALHGPVRSLHVRWPHRPSLADRAGEPSGPATHRPVGGAPTPPPCVHASPV